jgi:hypothetical protein
MGKRRELTLPTATSSWLKRLAGADAIENGIDIV